MKSLRMKTLLLLGMMVGGVATWAQAPVNTVLWSETWTGGGTEQPSAYDFSGTTVYGNATLTYSNSNLNTCLYDANLAGGDAPELLLSKSNETWTITNIPTGQAKEMSLSFLSNRTTFALTSSTSGISISGSQKSWTIKVTGNVSIFNLTLKNTGSANARIDNVELKVTTAGGNTPAPTYIVTFDPGNGTFVGNTDFPNASNTKEAGTYTLPSATPVSGYTFDGWVTTGNNTPLTGSYTVSGNVDFTAHYTQNSSSSTIEHTYNFAVANNFYTDQNRTTHPSTGSSNSVGTIYYGDGSIFVASGTNRYFSAASSGYFMLGKKDATISLPSFEGYKITQVKLHSSTAHSTSVEVSIVSGNNTASAAQTWSSTNKDYVYDIAPAYQVYPLSVKVTNNYNSQFTSITLVCKPNPDPVINAADPDALAYDATGGEFGYSITNPTSGESLSAASNCEWITNVAVDAANSKVTFITTTNSTYAQRQGTITLSYAGATDKVVTITQSAAPCTLTVSNLVNVNLHAFFYDDLSNAIIDSKNGLVSAQVFGGTKILLSVDPAEGYAVKSLMVNGKNVASQINEASEYIFTMPSQDVTITAAATDPTNIVTFDFVQLEQDYGSGVQPTNENNVYVTENKSWTNGNVTLETSGKYRWWQSNNSGTLRFYSNNTASTIVVSAAAGYYITDIAITGGQQFTSDDGQYASGQWIGAAQCVTLTYAASSGSVNVETITVCVENNPTKTVTSHGWATYIPDYNVQFAEGDAWVVTAATQADGITLASVSSVPANTPVLLKGAGTKTMTVVESAEAPTTNLLSLYVNAEENKYPWVLAKDGESACFKEWTGNYSELEGRVVMWLTFNDAMLQQQSGTRTLTLDEDGTQGISNIDHSTLTIDHYYDLQGRHVAQPTKGLYIVNGKKVIIK